MKATLEFDSKAAWEKFLGWWLDGGGEQISNFYSTEWNEEEGYIRINGTGEEGEEDD